MINHLVYSLLDYSREKVKQKDEFPIGFDKELESKIKKLKKLLFKKMYQSKSVVRRMHAGKEAIKGLYRGLIDDERMLPDFYYNQLQHKSKHRVVADYIASMSDRYAIKFFNEIQMKLFKYLTLVFLLLFTACSLAQEPQSKNNQTSSSEPMVIEDNSGLSKDEIREVAKKRDAKTKEKKKVSIKKVIETIDNKGKVDISKLQKPWEEMSPTPKNKDWVKTKSGEWFRGEIIAMYDDDLEFDSDEIGLYTFDFADIDEIKSHNMMSVNIEDVATFDGLLRFKDNKMNIIQGDKKYTFPKSQIVSMGPTAELESNLWTGKITLSADIRSGNKDEQDFAAKVDLKNV